MSAVAGQPVTPSWAENDAFLWRIPAPDALLFSAAGLLVLLIGGWVPDDRLNFSGVPLDLVLMVSAALLATAGTVRRETLVNIGLLQIPFALLFVTIAWSPVPDLGLIKFTTLFLSSNVAFLLLNTVVERHGCHELARILLAYLSVMLVAALGYKAIFGFFDRFVPFFLNGPIVFARFMTIAVIISLFYFRGWRRFLLTLLFCLAVLWTESKGPIIAVAASVFGATLYNANRQQRIAILLVILGIFVAIGVFLRAWGLENLDIGRLIVLLSLLAGDASVLASEANTGSLGARFEMWALTWPIILDNPLGVGLGGWDLYADTYKPTPYPHNLFLELWSEAGIVIGTLAALPFLYFLLCRKGIFWFIAFALFLAQLVSGDLNDARLMFTFSLLAAFAPRDEWRNIKAGTASVIAPSQETDRTIRA